MPIRLRIVCDRCHIIRAELSSWDKDHMAWKTQIIYCMALYRKYLPAAAALLHRRIHAFLSPASMLFNQGHVASLGTFGDVWRHLWLS